MSTIDENKADFDEEEEDFIENLEITADPGQTPMRLDKYLSLHLKSISRNRIQNAIEADSVKVNEASAKASYKIKPHDKIILSLVRSSKIPNEVLPEDIPLNIVYEDDDVLLVNKAQEMVVHPGHGNHTGTLVNALVHHFGNLPTAKNGHIRPGLVHRIDKGTSGLLVIAKTEAAMTHLAKQFEAKTTEREYIALVWGNVLADEGTVEGNIARHVKDRMQMAVFADPEIGKPAVTHYKVLERFGYVTLVSCILETGRTHQIRVHMKHIGHPLFNDARSGGDLILKATTFTKYKQFIENCFKALPRQALHAKTLGFVHPTTGEYMRFDTELPQDFQDCLEKCRGYSKTHTSEEEE